MRLLLRARAIKIEAESPTREGNAQKIEIKKTAVTLNSFQGLRLFKSILVSSVTLRLHYVHIIENLHHFSH